MENEIVGLENLPNVYITKIILNENTDSTYDIVVDLNAYDVKSSAGFIWKDTSDIFNFLKVLVIKTSSESFASRLSRGDLPSLKKISQLDEREKENTQVELVPISEFLKSQDNEVCYYSRTVKFTAQTSERNVYVFATPYLDSQALANFYGVDLSAQLSHYYGATTSEIVMQDGRVPALTNLFLKPDGVPWAGPIHNHPALGWMAGSNHGAGRNKIVLKQVMVENIKIIDNRMKLTIDAHQIGLPPAPIISDLHYSLNEKMNLTGLFSINFRQFAIQKTKHGKTMAKLSNRLFREFMDKQQINSIKITRDQVKTIRVTNHLGTPAIGLKSVMGPKLIAISADLSANKLSDVDNFKQIFLNTDPSIKHYQFLDDSVSAHTKGQHAYSVDLSIVDRSEAFIESKIEKFENDLGDLKQVVYSLNRRVNYDYKNKRLKNKVEVPDSMKDYIRSYCSLQTYFKRISEGEMRYQVSQKMASLVTANYSPKAGEDFCKQFTALITDFRRIFGVYKKYSGTQKPRNIKTSFIPNLISMSKQFEDIIQFSDYRRFYQVINKPLGLQGFLTPEEVSARSSLEVTRFFDPSKSSFPKEFETLDSNVSKAITNTDTASRMFWAPIAFHFDGSKTDLTHFSNVDFDGLSDKFIKSQEVDALQMRPWKASQKKSTDKPRSPSNKVTRKTARRNGAGKFKKVFSPSFRIPMVKFKSDSREATVNSLDYLGITSEFVNPDGNIIPAAQASDQTKVDNIFKATESPSKQNKLKFDLTTPNSDVGVFIASSNFKVSKLRDAPIAWKAMVCSRSQAAKNEILSTSGDILQNPITKITAEMIFQTSQQIEVLSGYETDAAGNRLVTSPIWSSLDMSELPSLGGVVARLKYSEIPELGIITSDEYKLKCINKVFIISRDSISRNIIESPLTSFIDLDFNMASKNKLSRNIKFATTNIISQSRMKDPLVSLFGVTYGTSVGQEMNPTATGLSTTRGSSQPASSPSSMSRGGGYSGGGGSY